MKKIFLQKVEPRNSNLIYIQVSEFKKILLVAVAIVLVPITLSLTNTRKSEAEKVTCKSFKTHTEAQLYFKAHPEATQLDRDKDGSACEKLPLTDIYGLQR